MNETAADLFRKMACRMNIGGASFPNKIAEDEAAKRLIRFFANTTASEAVLLVNLLKVQGTRSPEDILVRLDSFERRLRDEWLFTDAEICRIAAHEIQQARTKAA